MSIQTFAFSTEVAPQLRKTSILENPASVKASISCSTVRGVSK